MFFFSDFKQFAVMILNDCLLVGAPKSGIYVPPGVRDGRTTTGGAERRSEENTCRVTNLPEECDEQVC